MEKLSSILDNIKERFSSPLIFSFIISWIFVNWKISVALIWYDPALPNQSHLSLIEYISSQLSLYNSLYLPVSLAAAYTFIFPLIKNAIAAFYTWTTKWGDNLNLNISKGSKVPIEKYITLNESLVKKGKQLQDIIEKESQTAIDLQQTQTVLNEERRKNQELSNQYSESKRIIDNLHRTNIIDGQWNKSLKDDKGNVETQVIQISNSSIYINNATTNQNQYQINHFTFDIVERRIQFILFSTIARNGGSAIDYLLSDLILHSEEHLSGWEYTLTGRFQVEYKKPRV